MPAGKIVVGATRTGYVPKRKYTKKLATKQYVKNLINKDLETKNTWSLLNVSFNSIGTTWIEVPQSGIIQGATETQRIGNKVLMTSIEIKGVIAQASNETALDDPWSLVRIVLCTARSNTPMATAPAKTINSVIRNWNTTDMEKKYVDKYIPLQVASNEKGGGDGYAPSLRQFKYFKRWKNGYPLEFNGGGVADYKGNRLVLSMISDSAAIVNPGFVAGYVTMTFKDA